MDAADAVEQYSPAIAIPAKRAIRVAVDFITLFLRLSYLAVRAKARRQQSRKDGARYQGTPLCRIRHRMCFNCAGAMHGHFPEQRGEIAVMWRCLRARRCEGKYSAAADRR